MRILSEGPELKSDRKKNITTSSTGHRLLAWFFAVRFALAQKLMPSPAGPGSPVNSMLC